jgi:peroxiredoxin
MYQEKYGIDVEGDSGETHHQLPVPAAFVVDAGGRIVFAHADPDYRTRISPDALMEALQQLAE